MSIGEQGELVDVTEAARMLSVSDATVRNWIRGGRISTVDSGGRRKLFLRREVEQLVDKIRKSDGKRLSSRRNKTNVSGNVIPSGYVCEDAYYGVVRRVLSETGCKELDDGAFVHGLLAGYALKLFEDRGMMSSVASAELCRDLARDLAGCWKSEADTCAEYGDLLEKCASYSRFDVSYVEGQDFLGLLYMSLRCVGRRKSDGAYYTPMAIVRESVAYVHEAGALSKGARIIDPCCGTGNFMVASFLKKRDTHNGDAKYDLCSIYGIDIDQTSVMIARINLALASGIPDVDTLRRNVVCSNALFGNPFGFTFEAVIGNPPWGYAFCERDVDDFRGMYQTFKGTRSESISVFIEAGFQYLEAGGCLAYVVKDSLMSVSAHRDIRRIMIEKANIRRVAYWGDSFGGVMAPCATIVMIKGEGFSPLGVEVSAPGRSFTISGERIMDKDCFSYHMDDDEYRIVTQMMGSDVVFLRGGNARFALGIVTGDNKRFISDGYVEDRVPVIKGSDLSKYRIGKLVSHIELIPGSFQQIAPIESYMADEKLVYRFISDRLVFAYDCGRHLTLNSCNIVIPQIDGMSMKYVMAVLNSKVADFYFRKRFMSIKVLRSHIESIPIPAPEKEIHDLVVGFVDDILKSDCNDVDKIISRIDDIIFGLFGLSDEDRRFIECNP